MGHQQVWQLISDLRKQSMQELCTVTTGLTSGSCLKLSISASFDLSRTMV